MHGIPSHLSLYNAKGLSVHKSINHNEFVNLWIKGRKEKGDSKLSCKMWTSSYALFRSQISSNREAVYDYDNDKRYTYGDLEMRANKLANFLVARFSVKKGDRIAFCTSNCIELIDAYYATAKTGTILVTYNQMLSEQELIEMMNHELPSVLFYEASVSEKIKKIKQLTLIDHYVLLSDQKKDDKDVCYQQIMTYHNDTYRELKNLNPEDIHMLIHTGGTTGVPKGAKVSYRSLLFNTMSGVLTFNISHRDVTFILTPMFHTAGWSVLNLPHLHMGGRVVISKRCDPEVAFKIIEQEKPTTLLGVSTIFRMMTNHIKFKRTDFSSLRWVISAAAPTPLDIMEAFWQKGVKFILAYGMTEAGPCNLTIQGDDISFSEIKKRYNSVGKPMYFTQVKIVDDNDSEVPIGKCGEIIWRGPGVFSGYWKNQLATDEVLKKGWVYTGDIAKKDAEGYYYIVGRKKNMYITGGENIFPPEVEAAIYQHPAVHEVCVIGVPDCKWGEVGKAVIALKPNQKIDLEVLRSFLKGKIGTIKIPKYLQVVDGIPKNTTGKIKRGEIAKLYG